jgi:alkylation response protein AidB-like acyl-CoA dehydrogenase
VTVCSAFPADTSTVLNDWMTLIDLVPDDAQVEIAGVANAALQKYGGRTMDSLAAEDLAVLADLGLFGLGIGESMNGVGLGAAEEVLAFEAAGSHVAPVGLLAPVLAGLDGREDFLMITKRCPPHAAGHRRVRRHFLAAPLGLVPYR